MQFHDPYHQTICAPEGKVCSCNDGLVTFGSIGHLGKVGEYTSAPVQATGGSILCLQQNFGDHMFEEGARRACVCHTHDDDPDAAAASASTTIVAATPRLPRSAKNLLFVDAVGRSKRRLRIVEANVELIRLNVKEQRLIERLALLERAVLDRVRKGQPLFCQVA